jgi:hypothetical protein
MGLFDELGDSAVLKPGGGAKVALQRELELWRDERALGQGYVYKSGGDLLLKHGHYYQGRELPDQYAHLQGEIRRCFFNAVEAAKADPSLRYCEGVYSTGGTHFTNHGWCIAPDGGVVELTYPTRDLEGQLDSLGGPILPPEHWAYHGVIVTVGLAEWHMRNIGLPMLERPPGDCRDGDPTTSDAHDFPILKVPFNPQRTGL